MTIRGNNVNKPIFRDEQAIFVYHPGFREGTKQVQDTLYKWDNQQLLPCLSVQLIHSGDDRIHHIFTSGRYVIVSYMRSVKETRGNLQLPVQCIFDKKTRKARHAKNGFKDDIFDNGSIIIQPLFAEGMFYAVREEEYSEDLKYESNPTIYIGTFKK